MSKNKQLKRVQLGLRAKSPSIHYYDTDAGYIHYVSNVLPGLECSVNDSIRTVNDVSICPIESIRFLLENLGKTWTLEEVDLHINDMVDEAIKVGNKGVEFMKNIHKNSPLRDYDWWLKEGRALFMSQRKERLDKWRQT